MNKFEARRYVVSSKGNAFVAAWLSVIDQHKLPICTSVSADDWYESFEKMYMHDVVDDDVFNMCDVKRVFFSGNKPDGQAIDSAFWNLKFLRSQHPGEATDNEEYIMNRRLNADLPCPDLSEVIERPGSLVPAFERRNDRALDVSRTLSTPTELAMPDLPGLTGSVIERPELNESSIGTLSGPSPDVRGLSCQRSEPQKFGKPYTEWANFTVTCCDDEITLEDTGDGDWYEGSENEDHDVVELQLHGTCNRCSAVFHMGASLPLPKGTIGAY